MAESVPPDLGKLIQRQYSYADWVSQLMKRVRATEKQGVRISGSSRMETLR
jgi:hypothetical protein